MAAEQDRTADVIRELLRVLEEPGAINAGFAAHLGTELSALLPADRQHGTAFNGRLIAIFGVPEPAELTGEDRDATHGPR